MPIDPRIVLGIQTPQITSPDPLEQYGKVMTLKHLMQQGELGALTMQEKRRAIDDDEATRAAYVESGGDSATLRALLAGRGQYKAVQAFDKADLERRDKAATIAKHEAETGKIRREAFNKAAEAHRGLLSQVTDPQSAARWVSAAYSDPELSSAWEKIGPAQMLIEKIPQDPAAFAEWKRRVSVPADKLVEISRPVIQTRNTGQTTDTLAVDPFTGVAKVTGSVQNTPSPESVMTDKRTREEGAANRGVTMRGQNMTDSRQREANAAAKLSQPFEATINGRPVLVQQDKSTGQLVDVNTKQVVSGVAPKASDAEQLTSGYAKRMVEAEKLLATNTGGQSPGLIETYSSRSPTISNLSRSDERQRYHQAAEDWVRAKLRKESGAVIGDEEMAREIRTYFPQIGDSDSVIEQKARARKTAIEAMEAASGPARASTQRVPTRAEIDAELRRRGAIR